MVVTTLTLQNPPQTVALGHWLGQHLEAGTVLLLQGDLGSGKTTLVQGLGLGLGIAEAIDSPTFTLINEYTGGRLPLYHVDLYRLDAQGTNQLFLEAYWQGEEYPQGIMAIEWSERLQFLPPEPLEVIMAYGQTPGRDVMLKAVRPTHRALLETLTRDALLVDEI